MRNPIYIFLILLLFFLSCGQKKTGHQTHAMQSKMVDEIQPATRDVYDLIKVTIQIKGIRSIGSEKIRLLDSLPADSDAYSFLVDNELLKKYSRFDTISIYQAELLAGLGKIKPYQIHSSNLPNLEIIPADSIDFRKSYNENRNIEPFFLFYAPLISTDGKIAIISIDHICFGLCGQGWSLILMRDNDKWIKIGEVFRWIS